MIFRFAAPCAALAAVCVLSLGLGALVTPQPAAALPKYSQTEKKPCSYCHVNPKGSGPRTEAGAWYGAKGHTLKGFKPGAGKTAPKTNGKTVAKGKTPPKSAPKK